MDPTLEAQYQNKVVQLAADNVALRGDVDYLRNQLRLSQQQSADYERLTVELSQSLAPLQAKVERLVKERAEIIGLLAPFTPVDEPAKMAQRVAWAMREYSQYFNKLNEGFDAMLTILRGEE